MRMGWMAAGLALVLFAGGAARAASPDGKQGKPETDESHLYIEGQRAIPKTISITGVSGHVRIKWGNDMVIEGRRIVIHTWTGHRMITECSPDGGVSVEFHKPGTNGGSPDLIIWSQSLDWEFDPAR